MMVSFPKQEVPVVHNTDVLVIGGGPSGVAAAVGAARANAKVLLVEQSGFLGGVTTNNLYLRQSTIAGEGVNYRIIGGVAWDFIKRVLDTDGGTLRQGNLTFDYEVAKREWEGLALENGVEVLLNTSAFAAHMQGNTVKGAYILNKSGLGAIESKVTVDCSGDGDICASAGVPFDKGRSGDNLMQPLTMMMRFGGVDMTAFNEHLARDPRLRNTMAMAASKGDFDLFQDRLCSVIYWSGRPGVVNLNVTNQTHIDATDAVQLSKAEIEGRRQVWRLFHFLRRYVDGFANAWLIDTAPRIGVRETRRIVGEYQLTEDDVFNGREFPDTIALGSFPVDIHNPNGLWVQYLRIKAACYGIPYRCLVPLQAEQILAAGRIISTTHEALASTRVMFTCMALGHAAGVAAALAASQNVSPRTLDHQSIQTELVKQGAIISAQQAMEFNAPATLSTQADLDEYLFHTGQ
jgi:hypothetical protein